MKNCFIVRPAKMHPSKDRMVLYSGLFGPRACGLGLSEGTQEDVVSLPPGLFDFCCPPAVLWRVGAVVVDAVNGVLGSRAGTHIGKKSLKGPPPLCHIYPPAAIVVKALIGRVLAASE